MKRWQKVALPVVIFLAMVAGSISVPWVWAAISNISGMAVQGSTIQWNNMKDASQGDALTNGLPATAVYGYNGASWDRITGDTTNGLDVDVTRVQGTVTVSDNTSNVTPSDAFANPTTAKTGWSLGGVFNGTTWDRYRSATADALASTGLAAAGGMVYNGTTWDRRRSATSDAFASTGLTATGGMVFNGTTWERMRSASAGDQLNTGMLASSAYVFDGTGWNKLRSGPALSDGDSGGSTTSALLYAYNGANFDRIRTSSLASDIGAVKVNFAFSYSNIATNDNTTIKSGAGILHSLTIGTAGTTSSVIVYDNTTAAGTIIGTFSTILQENLILDVNFTTGLTVAPSGAAAANLTFSYK